MWHLRTKLGTFWVAPISGEGGSRLSKHQNSKKLPMSGSSILSKNKKIVGKQYYLGIDNQELGIYTDIEAAAKDVHDQCTGYFKWDIQKHNYAPLHINDWVEGEPNEWQK